MVKRRSLPDRWIKKNFLIFSLSLLLYLGRGEAAVPSAQQQQQQQGEAEGDEANEVEVDADGSVVHPPPPQTCAPWTGAECGWEPNLRPMTVDFGPSFQETFYAYVQPDVSTFYNATAGLVHAVQPRSTTQFGKFINLGPEKVHVYWTGTGARGGKVDRVYMAEVEPFGSAGTATYPGHVFVVTPPHNPAKVLTTWKMQAGQSLYYHDPLGDPSRAIRRLSPEQQPLYRMQMQNKYFAEQYRAFTGQDWLALYKQKQPPRYHMWRADAFGETHMVETEEIHFVEFPEQEDLKRGVSVYGPRPHEIKKMRRYRDTYPSMNLTLTVLSCAPRVFEIENFLSDLEVQHILNIAGDSELQRSLTHAGGGSGSAGRRTGESDSTRTSTNSWVPRSQDIIIDAIYRRSADVLQMHEALLRWRRKTELPEFTESSTSVAERLQLVRYERGQEYTPHHDFAMPGMVHLQPSRFATVLFYLNDVPSGGETSFPLWLNGETGEPLKVKPVRGKAVLFYNMLPDGNYDERSLHASLPVREGEKYLTNLWVWDPIMDHTSTNHL